MSIPFPKIDDFEDTSRLGMLAYDAGRFHDVRGHQSRLVRELSDPQSLDLIKSAYPRIYSQIIAGWGTRALQDKFVRWILTDQDRRKGWPKPVYKALFALSNSHAMKFDLEGEPIWDQTPDRW
jgi:hypothetical protein